MMLNVNDDLELKRILVNRRKRMFCNILRHFEERNRKGIVPNEMLAEFKSAYNAFVFEDAKEEYLSIKMNNIGHQKIKRMV